MPDSRILKLLLVEDDFEDVQLLSEALLEIEENRLWLPWHSADLVPVDRLEDALAQLRVVSFDAILLNLSLPDSPSLLDSFLELRSLTGPAPILVLADETDQSLADRLLREGAQDVLVKSEIECVPLARAIRHAIERERRVSAKQAAALVDPLTGALTREAFVHVARYRGCGDALGLCDIQADRAGLDPLLMQAADTLRRILGPRTTIARWGGNRLCVLAPEEELRRAVAGLSNSNLNFSIASLEQLLDAQLLDGEWPGLAKTAMLAD